ncbi:laglidadg endonuclease (mitochondrion) [Sclerotinia sclerotiorum 1980 UF-70]|uniref:Laglidadg endonuclease n=1 Tax=Sclerotinia sclerotiorum (strain ATCC 18683 / 1980 / Ss-1) TaxID=665079 RepID=A0A0K0PSX4_SCLS1|nr:laglidadg endonuclease [Sclerotinia sclerotiorum 1980 UF-70]AKQ53302.1 laglidadg endonuclease [Sclerotinia sclerotiorum 1980 UF-70]
MPVNFQTMCWKILLLITAKIGLSAGNLPNNIFLGFFRDYTFKFLFCVTYVFMSILFCLLKKTSTDNYKDATSYLSSYKDETNDVSSNVNKSRLSHYLAGLIEADGTIITPKSERSPKGRLYYPSIQIVFDSHDMSLGLMIQNTSGHGSLSKKKGANAYVLTFNNKESIVLIVSLINGCMRTPKIKALHDLIDWMKVSEYSDTIIPKLPLNCEPLGSNPWFAGFIDGDGHFSVRASSSKTKRVNPVVECRLELVQRQIYHNGLSNYEFMHDIAKFLNSKLGVVRSDSAHHQYRVRTINLASNMILSSYFTKYPLFSSKHLNYLDFLKVLELQKANRLNPGDVKYLNKVREIKEGMNNKRTLFFWDHLRDFYKLEK